MRAYCKCLVKTQKCEFSLSVEVVLWKWATAVRTNFPSQFHTKQEVAADTIQHALFPFRSFFFPSLKGIWDLSI